MLFLNCMCCDAPNLLYLIADAQAQIHHIIKTVFNGYIESQCVCLSHRLLNRRITYRRIHLYAEQGLRTDKQLIHYIDIRTEAEYKIVLIQCVFLFGGQMLSNILSIVFCADVDSEIKTQKG